MLQSVIFSCNPSRSSCWVSASRWPRQSSWHPVVASRAIRPGDTVRNLVDAIAAIISLATLVTTVFVIVYVVGYKDSNHVPTADRPFSVLYQSSVAAKGRVTSRWRFRDAETFLRRVCSASSGTPIVR